MELFEPFRLRIIFQNIPNYLILFVGIAFISIMLAMAIGMPSTLQYYKDNTKDMMFAFIFVGYLVVMLFDFRRIRKIPLDEALKRVE